jgi:hypothetical protein
MLELDRPKRKKSEPERELNPKNVIDQVRIAFQKNNRIAAFLGFFLGGFVPILTYSVAHFDMFVSAYYIPQIIVCGGLFYSAFTVFEWGNAAFRNFIKAAGFLLLIEGTMIFSHLLWLNITALFFLVMINGIATGVNLAIQSSEERWQP